MSGPHYILHRHGIDLHLITSLQYSINPRRHTAKLVEPRAELKSLAIQRVNVNVQSTQPGVRNNLNLSNQER